MARRLLRVALTGGIATGKSTCLQHFRALGVPTVDADSLSRTLVLPGTPALSAIVDRFGPQILASTGLLDRRALARIVFADDQARRDLEGIVHPGVFVAINAWFLAEAETETEGSKAAFAVADVPLLYETGHEHDFDRVVVAACRPEQQLQRLMGRDGSSEEDARRRIGSQWPIARKRELADYVVDTSGDDGDTSRQVMSIVERLRAEASTAATSESG
ncbi:MAG: dephospho-CoA kinase [Vicinamibacterales bacterium]